MAEVITGAEEAELSFRGAVGELDSAASAFRRRRPGWRLDRDRGRRTDTVVASYSADIGCVRLTERCLHSDPPTPEEVAAAREVVRERLDVALRRGAGRRGPHLGRAGRDDDHAVGAGAQHDDV